MECPKCKIDRQLADFLGKDICFKCIYREKIKNLPRKKTDRLCPLCNEIVPSNRLIYCSEKCKDAQDRIRSLQKYYDKKMKLPDQGTEL